MASTIDLFNTSDFESIDRFSMLNANSTNPYAVNIIDFSEFDTYGLVDRNHEAIIPKISNDILFSLDSAKTLGIATVNGRAHVLDFVADAYTDMINYLESVRFRAGEYSPDTYQDKNKKTRETFVQGLSPVSGYKNPVSLHKEHVNVIYDHFVRVYLSKKNRNKKINNHKDFLKMFTNYVFSNSYTDVANINLSSHVKRSLIPIECSGLVIKLSSRNPKDQDNNDKFYYGDPNFSLYALTADKFGFYIDEMRPWTLVANISSKKMDEYARGRGSFLVNDTPETGYTSPGGLGHVHEYEIDASGNGKTVSVSAGPYHEHKINNYCVKYAQKSASHKHELLKQDVFTKYFVRAQENEMDRLKNLLYRMYNSYVEQNPQNIINTFVKGSLVKKGSMRQPVSENNFNLSLSNKNWIRFYFDVKINEERVILKRNKYMKILRNVNVLVDTTTMQEAVDYINTEINKRIYGLLQGPNLKKEYQNLPNNNTLKKLAEYF